MNVQWLYLTMLVVLGIATPSCVENLFEKEEVLPPITTTGEGTFGCLVNGEAFVPRNGEKEDEPFSTTPLIESLSTADAASSEPVLYQNTPNPFTQVTEISMYLPESVANAELMIYDFNGNLISITNLAERLSVKLSFEKEFLDPGIYTYILSADNEIVGVRQMVITQ